MPNYCNYEAHIKGKKQNVFKLAEWLNADYHYSEWNEETRNYVDLEEPIVTSLNSKGEEIPTEHHIGYRVFNFDYDADDFNEGGSLESKDDDEIILYGTGDCAWSVMSCMFDKGLGCYMSDNNLPNKSKSISLPNACAELGVMCEIFSTEPGCCFSEHYLIDNEGNMVIDEETEYSEIWLGDLETIPDTYEEFVKAYKEAYELEEDEECYITEEEFNNLDLTGNDIIYRCDFFVDGEPWNYPWELV